MDRRQFLGISAAAAVLPAIPVEAVSPVYHPSYVPKESLADLSENRWISIAETGINLNRHMYSLKLLDNLAAQMCAERYRREVAVACQIPVSFLQPEDVLQDRAVIKVCHQQPGCHDAVLGYVLEARVANDTIRPSRAMLQILVRWLPGADRRFLSNKYLTPTGFGTYESQMTPSGLYTRVHDNLRMDCIHISTDSAFTHADRL